MEGGKIPIDFLGKKTNLQIFKESDFLGDSLHLALGLNPSYDTPLISNPSYDSGG